MSDLFGKPPVDLGIDAQVREAERELSMRLVVYPRRVAAKQMTAELADKQIQLQRAIIATLKDVKENGGKK